MSRWPHQRDMNSFYGNPDKNRDGVADRDWENENIIKITPPYPLWYPSDAGGKLIKRAKQFTSLRVHKKCADSLMQCLTRIGSEFTPEEIHKYELDICGGTYVFRLMRGGRSLSVHSWGSAIDLSHLINWYGRKYDESKGMMPMRAVKIFQDEGWTWGGLWRKGDAMHFQAADV